MNRIYGLIQISLICIYDVDEHGGALNLRGGFNGDFEPECSDSEDDTRAG